MLTVPAGTVVPLTLDHTILRNAKIGDSVSATVVFPVTVSNQFVIPVGADVAGTITAISTKKDKKTRQPRLSIHFTRITYPSGYIVSFDAVNTADLTLPITPSEATYADASFGRPHVFGPNPAADPFPQQQPPPVGPPIQSVLLSTGITFAAIVAVMLFLNHRGSMNSALFDAGWQFQMTTQTAFTIDTTKVIGTAAAH